jgi:hypothetical protein
VGADEMSSTNLMEQPETDANGDLIIRPTAVVVLAQTVAELYRVIRFRGRPMILDESDGFPHFKPFHKDHFDDIAYPLVGGKTRGQMADGYAYLCHVAEDLTENEDYILFGRTDIAEGAEGPDNHPNSVLTVWDMNDLTMTSIPPSQCVWRSPYAKIGQKQYGGTDYPERIEFIMQLAGGDEELYDDIMQSMAPLIMKKKPDGVIWWVGDGANGKSTLMDALYQMFPDQLASLTVKRLTDARDTPSLNGQLGNVVKESSEGRIDDTEIYKSIGTHENFRVHKFHSQESLEIRGNLHHIFNANLIPAFNDKGFSARRRTFIIPFNQRFASDPTFEERTFTPEFFGRLAAELGVYANRIKRQGYKYKWSAKTLGAKKEYDTEANNAEEYASELINQGVVAFDSFNPVKMDYDNWCADNGYVPLGVGNMRRAIQAAGFERATMRDGDHFTKRYKLTSVGDADLQPLSLGRPGMYTTPGFMPEEPEKAVDVPEFDETSNIAKGW